jgi:toxin ParE1/3/4
MKLELYITPQADQDIDEQFAFISVGSENKARKFYEAVFQTMEDLAQMPYKGAVCRFAEAELHGLRRWHVKGFMKHLIFYRMEEDTLVIVRILHAARDLENVLLGDDDE